MRVVVLVVILPLLLAPGCACDPLGFWSEEPVDDDDDEDEDESGEGEGEGEGDPDPPFLACCDFTSTDLVPEPYSLELNGAGVAHVLVIEPFGVPGAARSLQLGQHAGSSFALAPVSSDVGQNPYGADLVIDGTNALYLVETSSSGVSVAKRDGASWSGEDVAARQDPLLVDSSVAAGRPGGGVALLVAHVIVTTSDDDPSCPFNSICREYTVSLVEGSVVDGSAGDWTTTPVANNLTGLQLLGIGVSAEGTVRAAYHAGETTFVVEKAPGDAQVTPVPVTSEIAQPVMAMGPGGDLHLVGGTFGAQTTTHVSGRDGFFTTETLPGDPAERFLPLDAAADADGTLWFTDVLPLNDGSGGSVLRIVRHRGERFDVTEVATVDVDANQVFVGAELRIDVQGRPHVLVGPQDASFYLRPN